MDNNGSEQKKPGFQEETRLEEGKREKPKSWLCKNGHSMGMVVRNSSRIQQLILYRQALDPAAEVSTDVDVIATIEGYVAEIRCSVCGNIRTWYPGQESLEHLIRQARKMHVMIPRIEEVEQG
jgi:hypothetical protein